MGDIPGQWALLALAGAASQATGNQTAAAGNNTNKGSSPDWQTIVKGMLPMVTLFLGFIGQYLVKT